MYRNYGTQAYQQFLSKEQPSVLERWEDRDRLIDQEKASFSYRPFSIPVVFHVLTGPKSPALSRDVFVQQMAVLNQDFAKEQEIKHRADTLEGFAQRSRNAELTFCFPARSPESRSLDQPTVLIHQTDTLQWSIGNNMKNDRTGGASPWDPTRYLNVWVVDLKDNKAGFAQMPGGPVATDGIVIDFDFFGTNQENWPYHQGRTLTHLVGSYLGLHELWDEYQYCGDDGVADTPIHSGPNYKASPYRHVSLCPGNPVEMTMNFMDNSRDHQLYMFTDGQKKRMQVLLAHSESRKYLGETPLQCSTPLRSDLAFSSEQDPSFEVELFPNPAKDVIQLRVSESIRKEKVEILVYNSLGNQLIHWTRSADAMSATESIPTRNWPRGLYYLYIRSGKTTYSTEFVLID